MNMLHRRSPAPTRFLYGGDRGSGLIIIIIIILQGDPLNPCFGRTGGYGFNNNNNYYYSTESHS